MFGDAVLDACGVCEGTNITCVNPYSDPPSFIISCDTTSTVDLRHNFEIQHGAATWIITIPPTKGTATIFNSGTLNPPTLQFNANEYDSGVDSITVEATIISTGAMETLVIPITIGVCLDCFGVPSGPARLDECGVCSGDNSTCIGCDDIPNSGADFDYCGICGGDNSTCLNITTPEMHEVDCTAQIIFQLEHEPAATPVHWEIISGPFAGSATVNLVSGFVLYQNPAIVGYDWFIVKATSMLDMSLMDTTNVTFLIDNCTDCSGTQGGTQLFDLCGICGGDSSSCQDCTGEPNGPAVLDICGICNGDGTSCLDCFGVPYGGATLDFCGVCGGDNSTCGAGTGISIYIITTILLFLILGGIIWGIGHMWWYYWLHNNTRTKFKQDDEPELRRTSFHPDHIDEFPNLNESTSYVNTNGNRLFGIVKHDYD